MDSRPASERLLRLLVVLMAVVVAFVVGAAALGAYAYVQVRRSMGNVKADEVAQAAQKTQDMGEELTRRQQVISDALLARAEKTQRRITELDRRKDAIGPPKGGPIARLNQMTEYMVIMTEQMALLTEHLAQTQERLAKGLRPLPAQKEMVGQGRRAPEAGEAPRPQKR
jgi:hypothetical protein